MNSLLKSYLVDVEYSDVSGIEHLQMLENRSQLAELEPQLSVQEREALAAADKKLAQQAQQFFDELSRFVDLSAERQRRQISPDEWWWYLDVLAKAPVLPDRPQTIGVRR